MKELSEKSTQSQPDRQGQKSNGPEAVVGHMQAVRTNRAKPDRQKVQKEKKKKAETEQDRQVEARRPDCKTDDMMIN